MCVNSKEGFLPKKKALITGVRGQDGAYLSKFLLKKGYEVIGTYRQKRESNNWRLKELKIEKEIRLIHTDMNDNREREQIG